MKMDREEAAAYLHLSQPWRKMDDDERLAWCERAKELIAQGYTQEDIGQFAGMSSQSVRDHFHWSEGRSPARARGGGTPEQRTRSEFRRAPTDSKKELVVEAIEMYPEVRDAARMAVEEAVHEAHEATREYGRGVRQEMGTGPVRVIALVKRATAALRDALPDAQRSRFGSRQQAALDVEVRKAQAALDLISQAAASGEWDDELAELVRSDGA